MSDDTRKIHDALSRLIRDRSRLRSGGYLIEGMADSIDLQIRWPLKPAEQDPVVFGDALTEAVDAALEELIAQRSALRPGYAYCYACDGTVCEHATPPDARHILESYDVTGQPRWTEFSRFCLERRHAETDRLFGRESAFITWVQDEQQLNRHLPSTFRRAPFRLFGQVLAGFYDVVPSGNGGRSVLALTCQIAGFRSRRGAGRLVLNLIARTPEGEPVEMLWERQQALPWHNSIRWAQSALQTLRGSQQPGFDQRIAGILTGLSRRLQRDRRSRQGRTRHAEHRHSSRERPTRKALDDLSIAKTEDAFVDEGQGTQIILGERGRAHVFSPQGRHVTSIRYRREAIERKVRQERWRPASTSELLALQQRVAQARD
ncbi:MAG: hypothetical protein OEV00_07765 [Acidobacteriota bacterium]|nr:hypothetical protein [Acidobacteriota bacterium]MDH3785211.1 hypothetical protein [Acidobacteriota bacterium]